MTERAFATGPEMISPAATKAPTRKAPARRTATSARRTSTEGRKNLEEPIQDPYTD